jgi:glucose/mannose-6-phosphate isomerase
MDKTILETARQFGFEARIENEINLSRMDKFIVCGMGGSLLAAGLIKDWIPEMDIIGHRDYGLPKLAQEDLENRLIIFSSYSGNTEEPIDGYLKAKQLGLKMAVIATGGKLLEMAKADGVAYIQMPNWEMQPRSAIGLSLVSLAKMLGHNELLMELNKLSENLIPENIENLGKELAVNLYGKVPNVYTAETNKTLGYIWKVNFNETAKIPAFCNVIPELNHNEMNGFDGGEATLNLTNNFCFIFLNDANNGEKIKQRMMVTGKMLEDRDLKVVRVELDGNNKYIRTINSILLAEFTAYYLAKNYGVDAERVEMVEEFKKML